MILTIVGVYHDIISDTSILLYLNKLKNYYMLS